MYSHTDAVNLLKKFYASKITARDRNVLHKLLIFNKNYLDAGILAVKQAYMQHQGPNQNQNQNLVDIQSQLQIEKEEKDRKMKLLKEALQIFSQSRDLGKYFYLIIIECFYLIIIECLYLIIIECFYSLVIECLYSIIIECFYSIIIECFYLIIIE